VPPSQRLKSRARLVLAVAATALVLGPLIWLWQASLLPETYSVMDMGRPEYGGGPSSAGQGAGQSAAHGPSHGDRRPSGGPGGGHPHHGTAANDRSVAALKADPARPADRDITLVARKHEFRLASGRVVDGYTLNGQSPGPVIRAVQGELVQVRLINESVPDGITLHWHGVDVPNAEDGVAGVTQDAVGPGQRFTYRFVADQAGTFWYHSHQVSHEQVRRGLLGALIIDPPRPAARVVDVPAVVHQYGSTGTVNGHEGDLRVAVAPGERARVRVINTDNGPMSAWVSGAPFRVAAVDGTDWNRPTPVTDRSVLVTAGGRADLEIVMPADGSPARVHLGGSAAVVLGSRSYDAPAQPQPAAPVDLLSYGQPAPAPFDVESADRRFEYRVGRRPGFLDGRPGLWWTVNGRLYPEVPMYHVAEGDVVRMRISNSSGEVHPMHLHGHHALVLSRNGVPATGGPWWVDSLNVGNGETYEIAFRADNPGIWMDHCHNLPHAAQGLVAHVMYEGVSTPFVVGGRSGNQPE
jgi:FtsP/CotA-like multicopper oxidase with cupredoxin domain